MKLMHKVTKPGYKIYVAENLKRLRKELGYSLDDIAFNTGLSKACLSQIENKQSKFKESKGGSGSGGASS